MSRILVVQNAPATGLGRFEGWLNENNVATDVVHGSVGLPASLDGFDGLLLLGGGFMPSDDAHAAWLPAERALAAEALGRGLPTLGICLGAQVLALVAGGTVAADHGAPERGATRITLTETAAHDAVFQHAPASFHAIQNHRDAVTALPPGAVLLASSERCPIQAFRVGDRAWGVQFHPEIAASRVSTWQADAVAADGFVLATLIARADSEEPNSLQVCRGLADNFAAVVRETARVSASSGRGPLRF
ncbi:type 1 glutamine amidotransferase [Cryobacterium melibiosiphilum]|uniref:Type 1 glutamine amidotransferase n=1 Tax=Cryobacterium melibiosiphilum TaxID=995039 RepID=A0A3A5MKV4_9MICO|nr:type 1 glutamine amidotransferase [Cryobacterium melibiosiphilum]RJT89601.1 type 1 glutamine amidotransferase [Cryobacterium melibiosiphilum]